MTIEETKQRSWLNAIVDLAKVQGIDLPAFERLPMGVARTRVTPDGRYATFKRRLVRADEASRDAIEWTLWSTVGGMPQVAVTFQQPLVAEAPAVMFVLDALKQWLLDGVNMDQLAIVSHSNANEATR